MELKQWEIDRMSQEAKVKRYLWRVNGLVKCIEEWRSQLDEPEEFGVFNDWEQSEVQGEGMTGLMDEMVALACEVDPESVPFWRDTKDRIINLRIGGYKVMKELHTTPDPPMPTSEEEATAEAEKAEAYRTGGASLLKKEDGEASRP